MAAGWRVRRRITQERHGWLPWTLWGLTLAMVATALVLPPNQSVPDLSLDGWPFFLLLTAQALTFATVGLVLTRARPDNAVSWLFSVVGVFAALYLITERYQYLALEVRPDLPFGQLSAWLQAWLYVPALGVVVTLLPQLFPTGRTLSRRWSAGLWLAGAGFLGIVLTDALKPGVISQSSVENPVGIDPDWYDVLEAVGPAVYVVSALVAFATLVVRWRRAGHQERQQLKWFAYSAALIPPFVVVAALSELVPVDERYETAFVLVTATGAFLGLPVAVAISILRYQLYDIDLVIKRTLVYGALTALLVGAYLGSVLLFRLVLDPVTGESDLAVAASTLAVAGLFRPLRSRVQSQVDRAFYRQRYDAAHTLEAFTGRLRHELDLDALGHDLRAVVHDTMQPAHVSLWLRGQP